MSHAPLRGGAMGRCAAPRDRPARGLASFPPSCLVPPPCWVCPISIVPHYSPPHQDPTRTCRTRRAGAGAAGSGHGRASAPLVAAAAAVAPSSAAFGCWRARALARCARATLALRSRCARAAMHTRRPPGSRSSPPRSRPRQKYPAKVQGPNEVHGQSTRPSKVQGPVKGTKTCVCAAPKGT